jgi:transposase
MLEIELEQRTNIKFLLNFGKSGSEIREIVVQVYGENAMKKKSVYKWVTHFSEGREIVPDKRRSGRSATSSTHHDNAPAHTALSVREF